MFQSHEGKNSWGGNQIHEFLSLVAKVFTLHYIFIAVDLHQKTGIKFYLQNRMYSPIKLTLVPKCSCRNMLSNGINNFKNDIIFLLSN